MEARKSGRAPHQRAPPPGPPMGRERPEKSQGGRTTPFEKARARRAPRAASRHRRSLREASDPPKSRQPRAHNGAGATILDRAALVSPSSCSPTPPPRGALGSRKG